ncbi:MAG: hypothetical protein U0270_31820 [Labilithrix sp.]
MLAKVVDRALMVIAGALALSILAAGWHDVSQAYDVWYYHLPFAGRLVGLLDVRSFTFSAENQARYEGFPLLGELAQGLLWRITGHVAATNLVSVAALFGLPVFLWRMHRVPPHVAFLAFLAIPLVQIHVTSSYVDLPANACVTMLVLCVHRAWMDREAITRRFLIGASVLAAVAANMKFQLVPIVGVASLALAALALRRERRLWPVLAIAAPLVLATPIKNAIVHHNPVWPVALAGLPSVERTYSSSPVHLESSWRPTRFVRSVLEIDNRPIASHERWSLDQWTPPSEPAYRMGGYFGAYVAVALAALAWSRRRDVGIVFGGVTAVAALVPQSHELRYYMHWMLTLVAFALVVWGRKRKLTTALVALGALLVVGWSTEWGYLYPSGSGFEAFLAKRVDPALIDVPPGTRVCLERPPFTVLYAPLFHPGRDYTVQERAVEADCR